MGRLDHRRAPAFSCYGLHVIEPSACGGATDHCSEHIADAMQRRSADTSALHGWKAHAAPLVRAAPRRATALAISDRMRGSFASAPLVRSYCT